MLRKALKILLWAVLALLALFAIQTIRYWDTIQRVFLGGVKVYETTPPALPAELPHPAILVFSKTNAFRHEEAIPAANRLFADLARAHGWGYFQTENGATFTPAILSRFDAVVFNNVSGDVFTPDQRQAFQSFVEHGGGFVGIHAAGDNSHQAWPWYVREVIGTNFIAHTMKPQFQEATVHVENSAHPAVAGLPASWRRSEEWYSFDRSVRGGPFQVLLTVDEKTYNPVGMFGKDLRMGNHPVVWWRCLGRGRVLYSAQGHRAEAYAEPQYRQLLTQAVSWTLRQSGSECDQPTPSASQGSAKP